MGVEKSYQEALVIEFPSELRSSDEVAHGKTEGHFFNFFRTTTMKINTKRGGRGKAGEDPSKHAGR